MLYHEAQQSALCGMHAINTLLQGPMFTEVDLATIGQAFDERERAVMLEAGIDSADFVKFAAEESGNVATDGNFSIQVLEEALKVYGLSVVPLASSSSPLARAARENPCAQTAFLCNQDKHWLTLRKVDGSWHNFNSLLAAPTPVSELYLSILIAQLQQEGYTVYVVAGAFPRPPPPTALARGSYFTPASAAAAVAAAEREKAAGRTRGAAENALARAAASGGTLTLRPRAGVEDEGDDVELRRALAASLGEASDGWANRLGPAAADEEEEMMAAAIAASLEEPRAKRHERAGAAPAPAPAPAEAPPPPAAAEEAEPADGPGVLSLSLRLPDGARLNRRFRAEATLAEVAAALEARGVRMAGRRFAGGWPPAPLAGGEGATLAQLGVATQSVLTVQAAAREEA